MLFKKTVVKKKAPLRVLEEPYVINVFMLFVSLAAVLIIVLVFYAYIEMFGTLRQVNREGWGQFGDFIGGLTNPLLSFLGLLVLLNTFSMQLRDSKRTSESIRRQLEVSEKEKFENTFFKLVDRLDAYSEGFLRVADDKGVLHVQVLRNLLKVDQVELNKLSWKEGLEKSQALTAEVVSRDLDRLSLYTRKAVQCLKFLDASALSNRDKKFYIDFFRDAFHRYEFSLFLSVIFVKHPDVVHLVRQYKLAQSIRSESFCSVHVAKIFSELDISAVYPRAANARVD
ncbi:hypothetical protein ACW9H6_27555 [Pseudomonas sp. SDO528_S397]